MTKRELVVDSRGRANLNSVRKSRCDRYLVEEHDDGTLVLTPAVLVPAHKLRSLPRRPPLKARAALIEPER